MERKASVTEGVKVGGRYPQLDSGCQGVLVSLYIYYVSCTEE